MMHGKKLAELDLPADRSSAVITDVPSKIREGIDRYVEYGDEPGSFLYCCLGNDLQGTLMRADPHSMSALWPILQYIYNCVPSGLWGSEQVVREHIARGLEAAEG